MKIIELRQKRAGLVKQMRDLVDLADTEKRSLTAEEDQQIEKIEADISKVETEIGREERHLDLKAKLEQREKDLGNPFKPAPDGEGETRTGRAAKEYREAFWKQFREGQKVLSGDEIRSLQVGKDTSGGFLVPDEFEQQLIQGLTEANIFRSLATVIQTSNGDKDIPVLTQHTEAYWESEGAQTKETEAEFGLKKIGAHKMAAIIKVSEELLADSVFDIQTFITAEFARSFGITEEQAFLIGDGTGKPRGIVGDASLGVTTSNATAFTADEIIELFYQLPAQYRALATFVFANEAVKNLRKLKDNNGQYLWQPAIQAGQPDMLLSRPLQTSAYMPGVATGKRPVIFGDLKRYWIADRQSRSFQRLNEKYIDYGLIGFRATQRVDGLLTLPEAVVALQMK